MSHRGETEIAGALLHLRDALIKHQVLAPSTKLGDQWPEERWLVLYSEHGGFPIWGMVSAPRGTDIARHVAELRFPDMDECPVTVIRLPTSADGLPEVYDQNRDEIVPQAAYELRLGED